MKIICLSIAFVFITVQVTIAQITKVNLRADGLTCSMCSNAINKALRTLDFVEDVEPDLKTYTFSISFKPATTVDFDKIKDKVEDAGFSVSSFSAFINFNHTEIKAMQPMQLAGKTFWFINAQGQLLDGIKEIKVLNKGFVSLKEFKKIRLENPRPGNYLVHI